MRGCMQLRSADAFAQERRGLVHGGQWIYGSPDGRLYASVLIGPVEEAGIAGLLSLWRLELDTRGHLSLCDTHLMTAATPPAFAALTAFLAEHRQTLQRTVERQAIVLPTGMVGTMVAGYYRVFPPPYDYRLFDDRGSALEWLGYPRDVLAAWEPHSIEDPLLRGLRVALERELRTPIETLARQLGVSVRSLQRRLREQGTSVRREVTRAQVARAKLLLASSDQKLAAIAAQVGCSSLGTFTELFSREVGRTPSAWRSEQRGSTSLPSPTSPPDGPAGRRRR